MIMLYKKAVESTVNSKIFVKLSSTSVVRRVRELCSLRSL
jgi:hypothetical protein